MLYGKDFPMLKRTQNIKLLLFTAPALAVYTAIFVIPMLIGIYYSFTNWNGMSPTMEFVGFRNYISFFSDVETMRALQNTLIYTIFVTSASLLLGFILALALERGTRGNRIMRTLIFIPAVMSPVVASFIWQYMYSPTSGVINSIFRALGLTGLINDWLGDPDLALISVMIVPLWQWAGNIMIVFLAGLMGVSTDYHDAASIDGVNWWQRIRYITIPLIKPAMVFNVVISTIGSLKTFDFILIMTNGGPGYFTEVLTLRVYKYMVYTPRFGYGSAIAVILTLLVAVFALTEYKLLTRESK